MSMKRKYTKKNVNKVPSKPCAYKLYDKSGDILRNGSTRDCNRRLNEHLGQFPGVGTFSTKITKTWTRAHNIEKADCKKFDPPFNFKCG